MNCKKQTKRPTHPLSQLPQLPICSLSGDVEYSCLFPASEDLCPKNPDNVIGPMMAKHAEIQEAKKLKKKEERNSK